MTTSQQRIADKVGEISDLISELDSENETLRDEIKDKDNEIELLKEKIEDLKNELQEANGQ